MKQDMDDAMHDDAIVQLLIYRLSIVLSSGLVSNECDGALLE